MDLQTSSISIGEEQVSGLLLRPEGAKALYLFGHGAGAGMKHKAMESNAQELLAVFLLAHMNSAFISARAVHHIETNWAWAAGLPTGLIRDSWNIRLLPHYAFGAFFVLGHLVSGARVVMLNHRVGLATANRFWFAGLAISALIATAIIAGLCGIRL